MPNGRTLGAIMVSFALATSLSPGRPALAIETVPASEGGGIAAHEQAAESDNDGNMAAPELMEAQAAQADEPAGEPAQEPTATATGQDAQALDPANLANGTYSIAVSLRNASNLSQASMAGGAIGDSASLLVVDGTYALELSIGTIRVGTVVGHVRQIDVFDAFSVADGKMQATGTATPVWTAKSGEDRGPATVPVPNSAKADGYIAIQLHSDEMPVSPQKAALLLDWSTLAKVSEEASIPASEPASPEVPDESAPAAEDATAQTQDAQGEPSHNAAEPAQGTLVTGHVYSIPVYFTKAGTSETSMAAQYFGGTANARPRSDGTFDVRFSTNRPDYIESVSYQGAPATVTSDGTSREFSIIIPRVESDTVARLDFVITPMKELGAGSVSADMHLMLSQARDLGPDAGQVASSAGGGSSMPGTGDPIAPLTGGLAASALLAAGCALIARKRFSDSFSHSGAHQRAPMN